MVLRAEQVCGYDLDDVDQRWLSNLNGERGLMGQSLLTGEIYFFVRDAFSSDFLLELCKKKRRKINQMPKIT